MPKESKKHKYLRFYEQIAISEMCSFDMSTENDDAQKEDDILEDWTFALVAARACRYWEPFVHHSVPKSTLFLSDVLPNLDEKRFQQFMRVNWKNFEKLLNLIKGDVLFSGAASGKQFPIQTQLAIALYRLGSSGEGATLTKIASLFGIGDGGTIQITTNRVFQAIVKTKDKYLYWPRALERKQLVSETIHELPNCIGYVDGTEIKLAEKPTQDPEAFFSRKHIYSIKAQVVCDHKLRIRHLIAGYPGSVHDARIFNNSNLALCPEKFFSKDEWIAGDSAYKSTSTVVTPFRNVGRNSATQSRREFNQTFSRYRVRVEHTFMFLKERFNSLKELRIAVRDDNCIKKACKWIFVCAIIHNIILSEKGDEEHSIETPIDTRGISNKNAEKLPNIDGEAKRQNVMSAMNI